MPPLMTPQASRFRTQGASLAAGLTMPTFGSSYLRDGVRVDAVHVPRYSILALQMIAVEGRHRVRDACDVGVQLGLGRAGSDFRCGLGDAHATLAARVGLQWVYTEGVMGRVLVDAGYRRNGWLAFVSSGFGVGAFYGRTLHGIESFSSLDDLFVAPARPLATVSQRELFWSSAITLGVPLQGRTLSGFGGVTLDVPLAYTAGEFTSHGTTSVLADLRPGTRVGVIFGFSGILAP